MDFIMTLLVTIMIPIWYIFPCRIISMTFNTFSRSITIKNDKWAKLLIAEKNVWGIATNPQKKEQDVNMGCNRIYDISSTSCFHAVYLVEIYENRIRTVVRTRTILSMDSNAILCDCISCKTERSN